MAQRAGSPRRAWSCDCLHRHIRTQCGCKGIHDEFDSGRDRSRMERQRELPSGKFLGSRQINVWVEVVVKLQAMYRGIMNGGLNTSLAQPIDDDLPRDRGRKHDRHQVMRRWPWTGKWDHHRWAELGNELAVAQ